MFRKLLSLTITLLLASTTLPLNAASVSLVASSAQVNPGGNFTVDLVLNASGPDVLGDHDPAAIGGEVVIDYDPNLIMFAGFTPNGAVGISSDPVVGSADGLETITLGFNNAPDFGVVGTYAFEVIGGPNQTAAIGIADNDPTGLFGTFANILPTNQAFVPDFIPTSVMTVPVPAAAWFIASGLAVFGSFARRRRPLSA